MKKLLFLILLVICSPVVYAGTKYYYVGTVNKDTLVISAIFRNITDAKKFKGKNTTKRILEVDGILGTLKLKQGVLK